jgi:glutaryl-CoA dehydrogenase
MLTESVFLPSYFGSENNIPGSGKPVDFFALDDLLTEEEQSIRDRVHSFSDREIIPTIADYWERAEFPFEVVQKLSTLGISGGTLRGYSCPAMSHVALGLVAAELARGDGGINVSFGVHMLAMTTISMFGNEEQKERWLPDLASMAKMGAFAATEEEHGSDVISLETHAHQEGDTWVLHGSKKWIGNASFADVIVVWARMPSGQVSVFLIEKGMPGFTAQVINGKAALRSSWQTQITLENVRVPAANHLKQINSFNHFVRLINTSRYGLAWAAMGHSIACYEYALTYAKHRKQFGKPLVQFQLVQQKLARMLAEITSMQMLCWRLGRLIEAGKVTTGMISLAKMQTALKGRQVAADARDILGANGILIANHVARHMVDMEVAFTAEGTDHIQSLLVAREITGVQAIL